MRRGTRRNRAFDILTDRFGAMIDPNHFGGKSSFSIKRKKASPKGASETTRQRTSALIEVEKAPQDGRRLSIAS